MAETAGGPTDFAHAESSTPALALEEDAVGPSRSEPAQPESPGPDDDGDDKNQGAQSAQNPPPKNAFAELMAPKRSPPAFRLPPQSLAHKASQVKGGKWRGALAEYVEQPERFPGQVVRVTEHTVLIRDAFPKATVHLLLLPRSRARHLLHPHAAFADAAFLAAVRADAADARRLAAAELARLLGRFSASNRAREEALGRLGGSAREGGGAASWDALPPGRDYAREIRVGTHAHPSMAHLHVHVISRDMHSDRLRHRKHYNSFNTPFFVPLDDYPLAEDDVRWDVRYQNSNLARDLVCWRCGRDFGNRFAELKRHLEDEFEAWKRE